MGLFHLRSSRIENPTRSIVLVTQIIIAHQDVMRIGILFNEQKESLETYRQ